MVDLRRLAGRLPMSLAAALGVLLLLAVLVVVLLQQSPGEPVPVESASPERAAAVPPAEPAPISLDPAEPQPEALKAAPQSSGLHSPKLVGPLPDAVDVTVVDSADRPVPGADVLLRSTAAGDAAASLARSRRISELLKQDSAEARKALTQLLSEPDTGNFSGQPTGASWESPAARLITDSEGRCHVPLTSVADEIYAMIDGVGTSGVWTPGRTERDPDQPTNPSAYRHVYDHEVRLRLLPRATISGVVLDTDGEPIVGAVVSVTRTHSGGREVQVKPLPVQPVVSDELGRFKMKFDAPVFARLGARKGTLVTAELDVHPLDPGEETAVELRVPGGYAVSGRVLRADGTPVAAAKVHSAGWNEETVPAVVGGADGTFKLPLTKPDSFVLMADSKGLVTSSVVNVTVSDEVPEAHADVTMLPASHVAGHVRWSTGEPIAHATINVSAVGKSLGPGNLSLLSTMSQRGWTDESGAFRAEGLHPDLPCVVSCFVTISALGEVENVQPGREDVEVVIDRATAEGVTIEVDAVDDATGQPVPAYTLWHDFWNNGLHGDATRVDVANSDGRFLLEHCGTTVQYGFNIQAEGYALLRLGPIAPSAGGTRVVARLGRTGTLRVTVTGRDGTPAAGAHVYVGQAYSAGFDRFDPYSSESTQPDGSILLQDVPPDRYVVIASEGDSYSTLLRAEVAAGRVTDVFPRLADAVPPGELEITACDKKGEPYRGAEVDVTWQTAYWASKGWDDAGVYDEEPRTDEQGHCLMQDLRPGLYWIYVSPGDTFIPPVQAQVFSGERAHLDFVDDR